MISIDKASDKSLYEQLYEQMKSEILNEHYAAGEKLPATRQLAAEHKLSRNTVVSAYNQLELEGYIRSVTGSGYYVENISAFSPDKKPRQSHNIQHSSRQSGKTFDYTFSYGNLTFSADLSSLPQSGVGELITKTLKTSSDTANTQTVHMGDAWETKGTVSGVDFTLRRGDNGLPQSLEIPKALLTAEFCNVSPK